MLCSRLTTTLLLAATCLLMRAGFSKAQLSGADVSCDVAGNTRSCVRTTIACEGSLANLQCDGGQVISVVSANYGRHDRTTCSAGRPASQFQNVYCSRPTKEVAASCDRRSSCVVSASNTVFGDPCVNTYKYLEVKYKCEFGTIRSVACEGSLANLQCDGGKLISVLSAEYGRRDSITCSIGRPTSQTKYAYCLGPMKKVALNCDGRSSCIISATNFVFGDPCYGTYKYLEVIYKCEYRTVRIVACEGSLAKLQCDDGQVITIVSANYGRRDRTTCSAGRPASQVQNVHCWSVKSKVAASCDRKSNCAVSASNTVFGDPCYGIYKYLDVMYKCE